MNVKTANRKELWLKALVDSSCTHIIMQIGPRMERLQDLHH